MTTAYRIASDVDATSLAGDERWQAVQRMLTSAVFLKAPRMCELLSFLMIRKLSGMEKSISEYAIGIEVFRRDARDYDTTIDPVVRVQMGRLRERLEQYYAQSDSVAEVRIAIPAGSYVPELSAFEGGQHTGAGMMQLGPVCMLTPGGGAEAFGAGLQEELALRLFRRFSNWRTGKLVQDYRIDVSIRVESGCARAAIHLVDAATAQVVWLQQCDAQGELGIALQEDLAEAICKEVQDYFAGAGSSAGSFAVRGAGARIGAFYVGGRTFPS